MQAINKLASFFNTVRQAIFHFKPNGFDSRKASRLCLIHNSFRHPVGATSLKDGGYEIQNQISFDNFIVAIFELVCYNIKVNNLRC